MTALDPAATREVQLLKHDRQLMGCRFDPSGKFLFAWGNDHGLHRFDLATGTKVSFADHDSWVYAVTFTDGGNVIWSAGGDGRLIAWPALEAEPKPIRVIEAHEGWVRSVVTSPDGELVASAGNDCLVKLWSAADGTAVATWPGHSRHVYKVIFHPSGKSLVSGDLLGVLKDWDLASGKPAREFDAKVLWKYDGGFQADIGGIRGISFAPDGARLACSGITEVTNAFAGVGKPLAVLIDWSTGKGVAELRPAADFQGVGRAILPYSDQDWIGLGGGGGGGRLWFWRGQETSASHTVNLPIVPRGMDLHPDRIRLAIAGHDGSARIYQLTA